MLFSGSHKHFSLPSSPCLFTCISRWIWLWKAFMDFFACDAIIPRGLSWDVVPSWLGACWDISTCTCWRSKGAVMKDLLNAALLSMVLSMEISFSVDVPCPTSLPGILPNLSCSSRLSCEIIRISVPSEVFFFRASIDILRHLCQLQRNYFNCYLTCSKIQALGGFGSTWKRLPRSGS